MSKILDLIAEHKSTGIPGRESARERIPIARNNGVYRAKYAAERAAADCQSDCSYDCSDCTPNDCSAECTDCYIGD